MKSYYKDELKLNREEKRFYKLKSLISKVLEENEVTNYETFELFSSFMGFIRSGMEKEERGMFDRWLDERVYKHYSFFKNMQGDADK